jgi:hypothetical protein
MAKDASFFTSLNEVEERKIYVVNDFSLDISSQGDVSYIHGRIIDVYHILNLNLNLKHICNIVEFWPDR